MIREYNHPCHEAIGTVECIAERISSDAKEKGLSVQAINSQRCSVKKGMMQYTVTFTNGHHSWFYFRISK